MSLQVTKRDGSVEPLNIEKIHKVAIWATEGLSNVSASEVEIRSKIQFYTAIKTKDIHETLIKAAATLISVEAPDYQYVAGRLVNYAIRKEVYGGYTPLPLYTVVTRNVLDGFYDPELLDLYTKEEFDQIDSFIDHARDFKIAYAGMEQLRGKYLVQNRVTGELKESPQIVYALVAATLFGRYPRATRMQWVRDYYDAISLHKISLPTPIMAGVRTPERQFSSCVLIESDDSLDSIIATTGAIAKYVSQRAGIGIGSGRIRAVNSPVRGGKVKHTGVTPYFKLFDAAVGSCSQGSIRKGSATLWFPFFHREFDEMVVLKNNKGTQDTRVRTLDYGVQFNRLPYERLIQGGDISLFCPNDVPALFEAFFADQDLFKELYEAAEANPAIPRKTVSALDLFTTFAQERKDTGRIYLQNVDNANQHSPFDERLWPVKQSNLCVAPETQILTRQGYRTISDLAGHVVDVWNGEEWSASAVAKTGTEQRLVRVLMSDGSSLDVTPYHKFYVQDHYHSKQPREVRAADLRSGDKLAKWDMPVVDSGEAWENAYLNGFFSADGTYTGNGHPLLWLYGDKRELMSDLMVPGAVFHSNNGVDRDSIRLPQSSVLAKFSVPVNGDLRTKLEWLAGYADGDGTIARNGTNQQLQFASVEPEFLSQIRLLLGTLGVQAKIAHARDAGMFSMPDGRGGVKEYACKEAWRVLVTSVDLQHLVSLGFSPRRLKVVQHTPKRNARQFVSVVSVEDNGRIDDTYCFNEPKKHKGILNGVLTGNCAEINLPTRPLKSLGDPEGRIALCTLSAINWGAITLDEMPLLCALAVRALDALLDYQDYPVEAARHSTREFRPLGVGVINLAYWIAKNGFRYSDDSALALVDEWMESMSYNLIKASVDLAEEVGPCEAWQQTKFAKGVLPPDTRKTAVDALVPYVERCDWDTLRGRAASVGQRNSTLMAFMPAETSAQVANATNGIEPPRSLVSIKASKHGVLAQVVPEIESLGDKYELLWDQRSPVGYLNICAVLQKWTDQGISVNTSYNPSFYEREEIPLSELIGHILHFYKFGGKQLYYNNTNDQAGEVDTDKMAAETAETPVEEESCDSCTI